MLHRLVSVPPLKGISLTSIKQEETHIRVDYTIIFPVSAAVCTSLSQTDRYTARHAKIRSAVGAGVGGALFNHLIL